METELYLDVSSEMGFLPYRLNVSKRFDGKNDSLLAKGTPISTLMYII